MVVWFCCAIECSKISIDYVSLELNMRQNRAS